MKSHGLTLLELLITITILCIVLTIGIPSFTKQISETRTKTATLALLEAIETTRSIAVSLDKRTILIATNKKWHQGWTLFVDNNADGTLDQGDEIIQVREELDAVMTTASSPMNSYIAFVGTGEGRQLVTNGFLSGNIKICPKIKGEGYSLILSKGGRTRLNKLTNADCSAMR